MILGANTLRIRPIEQITDPNIADALHPYLFVTALATGPENRRYQNMIVMINEKYLIIIFKKYMLHLDEAL